MGVDTPSKVVALRSIVVRSIACGAAHAIAVDISGRAYSWGAAQYGQLGYSNPPRTFSPPPTFLVCVGEDHVQGDAVMEEDGIGPLASLQHQPTLIQSVSRLHIMKAACGLHNSLIVSEVSSDTLAKGRASRSN